MTKPDYTAWGTRELIEELERRDRLADGREEPLSELELG